jgi:hypothetical protein
VCLMEESEFGKHGKHYFDVAKSMLDSRPSDFVQKVRADAVQLSPHTTRTTHATHATHAHTTHWTNAWWAVARAAIRAPPDTRSHGRLRRCHACPCRQDPRLPPVCTCAHTRHTRTHTPHTAHTTARTQRGVCVVRVHRAGEVVYIHCYGGHGRTGIFASVLLGRIHGIDAEKALQLCKLYHDCRYLTTRPHAHAHATLIAHAQKFTIVCAVPGPTWRASAPSPCPRLRPTTNALKWSAFFVDCLLRQINTT